MQQLTQRVEPASQSRSETARTQAQYDRIAPFYDRLEGMMERLRFRSLRRLLWGEVPDGRGLEAGVGTGKNISYYPEAADVVAIDLSSRMLERARERAASLDRDVDLREMDVESLAFPDDSFDWSVATFVFCSVPDPVAGLRELARVTKPEGQIYLLEHLRPRGRLLGFIFDLLNPFTLGAFGFNINRRTADNIRAAGLTIETERALDSSGILRMFEVQPGGDVPSERSQSGTRTDPVCGMDVDERDALSVELSGELVFFCSEGCRKRFLANHPRTPHVWDYELIIVGGGPAGLTAAVYAATMKLDAFLVTRDLGGQAIDSAKIVNYMGYDFITGPELIAKFRDQVVQSQYIDHLIGDVARVSPAEGGFTVTASTGELWHAESVILATGMTRRKLRIPGEEEFQRKGIFYGNVQDYTFVQGQDVAVIGGGNSALQMVETLGPIAGTIHLISDFGLTADQATVDRVREMGNVMILENSRVLEFRGSETLSSVRGMRKAEEENSAFEIPIGGVFVAIGSYAASGPVGDLLDLNAQGEIAIGPDCSTLLPGLFAAGDVTNTPGKRIIIASGEGAKAALAARKFILELRKERRHG